MVVRNDEETVGETLNSFSQLGDFLVGDIGSTDSTAKICRSFGATVVPLSLNDDMSAVRNSLISYSKTDWNLWIEPWETLLLGDEIVPQAPGVYRVWVMRGDVATKPNRLWHKRTGAKFKNPVFETLVGSAEELPIYLSSSGGQENALKKRLLEKWREKSPLSNEVTYYESCLHLTEKNWKSFLNTADHYLHRVKNKETMSAIMTRYYGAMVSCYIEKDGNRAVNYLLPCIVTKPLMAEFWCLLGDIYYSGKSYDKAKLFYENALVLGRGRLSDEWPMEISKYKDYPEKMASACEEIRRNVRFCTAKPLTPRSFS